MDEKEIKLHCYLCGDHDHEHSEDDAHDHEHSEDDAHDHDIIEDDSEIKLPWYW